MFNVIISLFGNSVKTNLEKIGASALSIEWVLHYLKGSQKEKTLPKEAVKSLRRGLKLELEDRLMGYLDYPFLSCTAEAPRMSGHTHWWKSLMGVVGAYEWTVSSIEETGIKVSCWDTWDFNPSDKWVSIPIGHPHPLLLKFLDSNNIIYEVEDNELNIQERSLMTFNKGHAFMTKWEEFFSWEELGLNKNLYLEGKDNPYHQYHLLIKDGYICPKWREQQYALFKRGISVDLSTPEEWDKLAEYWKQI
jgi:hypothetical protein